MIKDVVIRIPLSTLRNQSRTPFSPTHFAESRFIPANPSVGLPVRRKSQHPKDRLQFFFSFEMSYLRAPMKPRLGGLPKTSDRLSQKQACYPHFHCAE